MTLTNQSIEQAYALAQAALAELGVDTERALETLSHVALSLHCWQGDDVSGFENSGELSGGIAATGNYPGKARTADELRRDLDVVYRLLPGQHRLNLHAIYAETNGQPVARNELQPTHFAAWLDCANVIPVSFEEMVGSPGGGSDADLERLIWSLQLKLHIPGNPAEVRARMHKRDSATFREGRIGGWREKLSPSALTKLQALPQDFMARFGYGADATLPFPAQLDARQRRALSLSKADFSDTPILVSTGILQNNIILYRGRYYAVPMSWGSTELTRLSHQATRDLPSGDTEVAVLSALLASSIGIKDHIGSGSAPLFSVGEFNVIQSGHTFYGAHQRLGPIDFRLGSEVLRDRYSPDDLVIASSPVAVVAELAWHEMAEIWQSLGQVAQYQSQLEQQNKTNAGLSDQITAALDETRDRTAALQNQLRPRPAGAVLGHRIYRHPDGWMAIPRSRTDVSLADPERPLTPAHGRDIATMQGE